jgi:hypothetical protein
MNALAVEIHLPAHQKIRRPANKGPSTSTNTHTCHSPLCLDC